MPNWSVLASKKQNSESATRIAWRNSVAPPSVRSRRHLLLPVFQQQERQRHKSKTPCVLRRGVISPRAADACSRPPSIDNHRGDPTVNAQDACHDLDMSCRVMSKMPEGRNLPDHKHDRVNRRPVSSHRCRRVKNKYRNHQTHSSTSSWSPSVKKRRNKL